MKPRIFPSEANQFNTMGYGQMNALSCKVTESLNGEYFLNMVVLNTDPEFSNLKIGNIITAKPNESDPIQAFCIEQVNKLLNGEVEVYATHIAQFRSKLIPVGNFTATDLSDTISKSLSNSLEANPFSFTTNKSVASAFTLVTPRSFRELLGGREGSILDLYGGEYHYDNFSIELLNKRGKDNGVIVFYGGNMVDFTAEDQFDWDESATGVVPFWYAEENNTLVLGDAQYSSNESLFPYKRTIVKDYTDDYDTTPTKAQLESDAAAWIQNKGNPSTTFSVSFDELVTNNRGKLISLGDTVHIINSMYEVNSTARIVKTEYDVLLERYANIEIGKQKETINDAISDIGGSEGTSSGGGSVNNCDLLWQNSSVSSGYSSGTISLDLSEYALVYVRVLSLVTTTLRYFNILLLKGGGITICSGMGNYSANRSVSRYIEATNTGVEFKPTYYSETYATTEQRNDMLVPYQIYGIRCNINDLTGA